jgi:parallel beta-helix repeat protein
LPLKLEVVKASGTVHIRADGSVDPSLSSLATADNITYTFTEDITGSFLIERSNIVVDGKGYTLLGSEGSCGFNLSSVNNVAIRNTNITGFDYGIRLCNSSDNSVFGNNLATNHHCGIELSDSSNSNRISGNNMTNSDGEGILLEDSGGNSIIGNIITLNMDSGVLLLGSSNRNSIFGNNITANKFAGIMLFAYSGSNSICRNNIRSNGEGIGLSSSNNSVSGNNITSNGEGIAVFGPGNSILGNNITANNGAMRLLDSTSHNNVSQNIITANKYWGIKLDPNSFSNHIYHNDFGQYNPDGHQVDAAGYNNSFDLGYPSGGNYWSDYNSTDLFSGPYQNETGRDGIGDTPYTVTDNNTDYYPLMQPYNGKSFEADLNKDGAVNILDIFIVATAYGSKPGDPNWNAITDLDNNGAINILDIFIIARDYGKTV